MFATEALAEAKPDPTLTGISALTLSILGVDNDAKACGITEEGLTRGFMYPASSARFRVRPNSDVFFEVRVLSIKTRAGVCFTSIDVAVTAIAFTQLPHMKVAHSLVVTLWSDRMILSGTVNHPERAIGAIEDITKKFVTDWNLANK